MQTFRTISYLVYLEDWYVASVYRQNGSDNPTVEGAVRESFRNPELAGSVPAWPGDELRIEPYDYSEHHALELWPAPPEVIEAANEALYDWRKAEGWPAVVAL